MKKEITHLVERLELLEEKFGVAISGLYASYKYDAGAFYEHTVEINFDLTSLNGGKLECSFDMISSVYNSEGQLLQTTSKYVAADDFIGFSPFSITHFELDQTPKKIRLFPAVSR